MLQLVPNLKRLGTETAFEVLARAADARSGRARTSSTSASASPTSRRRPHIVEAAIKALRDGHHGYTPAQGILPLREAVAKDLQRRHGVEVDPDTIVIMPGGKPTMFFSILMFGQPGAEIMYPDPGFPIYRSMIEYTGAKPVPIALQEENGFAFTADEVLAQITPKTSLIILNSPDNPCGGAVPAEEVKRLVAGLAQAPQRRHHVGRDLQPDALRRPQARELPALPRDPRPADPARRLVQDLRHDRLAARLLGVAEGAGRARWCGSRVNCHSCVNAPTQYAGIAALEGPQDEVRKMVAAFDERRRVIVPLLNQLPGFTCLDPGGAFYVFPNITGTGMDAQRAAEQDAGEGRRRHRRRHQLRHPRRGLHPLLLRQLGRQHPRGDQAHRGAVAGLTLCRVR